MKNGERLFEKFGEVNEKYIHEVENFAGTNTGSNFFNENTEGFQNEITEDSGTEENIRIVRKTGENRIVKTAAIAAAFLLVCGGIFKYHLANSNNGNNIAAPASTVEVSDTEVAEETEITESVTETKMESYERNLVIAIPENVRGEYNFKVYINDNLISEKIYDVTNQNSISIPMVSEGMRQKVIILIEKTDENGNTTEAQIGKYLVSFDPNDKEFIPKEINRYEIIEENVEGAFRAVCGSY